MNNIATALGQVKLRPNSFAGLRRLRDIGRTVVETAGLGADRLLKNTEPFRRSVAAGG